MKLISMKMKSFSCVILAALLLIANGSMTAKATVVASAELTQLTPQNGSPYTYSITLHNNSTAGETFSTFWFAWVPAQDYMPVSPSAVAPPAGWAETITHGGASDGYAIRFTATTPLAAGSNQTGFVFQSTATLSELRGNSVFFSSVPVTTSEVFSTSDPVFVVTVPDFFDGTTAGGTLQSSPWFGSYDNSAYPLVYQYYLGYEYAFDAGNGGVYLYDYATGHYWYTQASYFPYLYDFTLNTFLYYYDSNTPHRHFYNFGTSQVITL